MLHALAPLLTPLVPDLRDTLFWDLLLANSKGMKDTLKYIWTCLRVQAEEAVSFISWGPAGPNGECTAGCGDNKVEELPPGAPFTKQPIPYGSCTGAPICVYVHDGTFRRGSTGVPLPGVPETCYSSQNQLCEMCGSYLVTVCPNLHFTCLH